MPISLEIELWKVFKQLVAKHKGDDWYDFWREHFRDNEQWWKFKESKLCIEDINQTLETEQKYRHMTTQQPITVKKLLQRYGEHITFHNYAFEEYFMNTLGLYSGEE